MPKIRPDLKVSATWMYIVAETKAKQHFTGWPSWAMTLPFKFYWMLALVWMCKIFTATQRSTRLYSLASILLRALCFSLAQTRRSKTTTTNRHSKQQKWKATCLLFSCSASGPHNY